MTKRPRIVAEISANHQGSFEQAIELIDAAKWAGADGVKIQTWSKDAMVLGRGHFWNGIDLVDLYRYAHTPWEWHEDLFRHAAKVDIELFSSPFDIAAVDFLETLHCPRYKIASFELTDLRLIERAARTQKPIVLSTGMASFDEIVRAMQVVLAHQLVPHVVVLKCTSSYPAPLCDANLITLGDLQVRLRVAVGISDHTPGDVVPIAAAGIGVAMIEKHLVLRRGDGALDEPWSLEVDQFKQMVEGVHAAFEARGEVKYGPSESEKAQLKLRRGLFAVRAMKAGEQLKLEDIITARPNLGLPADAIFYVVGRTLSVDINAREPLTALHVDGATQPALAQ